MAASADRASFELNNLGTLRFYWRTAVRAYPRQVAAIGLLTIGSAVLDAATIGLTVPLLDVLTAPARAEQSRIVAMASAALRWAGASPTMPAVLLALMGVAGVLFIVRSAFFLWTQYATAAIAVTLRRRIKSAIFERFLHADYEEMSRRSRGTVVNDINLPAESLAGAITQLSSFATGVVTSALMIVLLLYLSWWATLLIGAVAIGGVQGWRRFADRRAARYGRVLYDVHGEQNKLQVDAIDGLKVVKAYGLAHHLAARQDALSASELKPELRLVIFRHGPAVVNELVAIAIVMVLGAATFLMPSLGLRFSMLAAFLLAIRRIAPSLATVNLASVNLNRHKRDLEVIQHVLEAIPQERRGGRPVERVDELRLDGVSFAYASRPAQTVLHDVRAMLRHGTITALVGATGSGKSTIAQLVMGLYEPRAGAVQVNGAPLGELDLAAWRRMIGYVSQDVFVFNATLRDNILLGDARLSTADMEHAARVVQLHDFIAALPEGYETVIGDRGLRLSGGQCQRLAIARAIVRHPQVLIFDEATSALDSLTERAVYDAISSLHRQAVVLVIAHRLTTIKDAEQILVLEAGRIVEQGTHESLLRQSGLYARLYAEDGSKSETATVEVATP